MSSSEVAIAVRGLSKAYTISHEGDRPSTLAETVLRRVRRPFQRAARETFWALRDLSFDILKGQVVGIIGRNGAGKSTLLKILSRITEPTSGEIDLYGRVGSLLEVGTGFHPELTGRENIFLNGAILGMAKSEIRQQFDAIVDFAGVEKFLDTPVKRYSSGMYVRLAFAVAAHLNPEILIVDEVLAVGDAEFQSKCLGKMKDVSNQGRTVLFVSHNIAAIQQLCTHGILLSAGRLKLADRVGPVITEYVAARAEQAAHLPANERFAMERFQFTGAGSGEPTTNLIFGEDYLLQVAFRALVPTRFALIVEVRDANDVLVSSINTPEEGMDFFRQEGRYVFQIRFKKLALLPGSFRLHFLLCDEQETFLGQRDILVFTVDQQNLPGAPWPYKQEHGYARLVSSFEAQLPS